MLKFFGEYQRVWLFLTECLIMARCSRMVRPESGRPLLHSHPLTRMAMEGCAMHIHTCENPPTIGCSRSAAVAFATRLNHKLPFLFGLPSYDLWSECKHETLNRLVHVVTTGRQTINCHSAKWAN